ncbi:sulfite exporter TauE/SafE family protein [Thiohalobacter sp. IOR34]|uniref:sulfite exporter TauE/SafE family protein n=1 Tax=Thiohalobacter sp. IOR34 TaxID=3057176 RepID=UPI0025B052A3|nr:sulfite exporter TauE/SafE family protein [Thiohalobacter sp. IOR34]WJW76358.1 sulfite exporter TauE/SafE family protein [Thiohalobacter sp. IOR34]
MSWLKGIAIGLVAGTGGGLMSLGGGTLVIPLLMGWAGLGPLLARGTALAVSVFSAATGSLIYARHGQLDLLTVLWVALPSFLITPLAAAWSEHLPPTALKRGFGLVVMAGGLLMIFRDLVFDGLAFAADWAPFYLLGVGVVEGLVAGIIGISGGPVLAPLFVLGLGMPQQLAQGCSLAARLPAVLSGSWENWRLGNVCRPLVLPLALGALAGATLGSRLALALPEPRLRLLFGLVLIGLGLRYLLRPGSRG